MGLDDDPCLPGGGVEPPPRCPHARCLPAALYGVYLYQADLTWAAGGGGKRVRRKRHRILRWVPTPPTVCSDGPNPVAPSLGPGPPLLPRPIPPAARRRPGGVAGSPPRGPHRPSPLCLSTCRPLLALPPGHTTLPPTTPPPPNGLGFLGSRGGRGFICTTIDFSVVNNHLKKYFLLVIISNKSASCFF